MHFSFLLPTKKKKNNKPKKPKPQANPTNHRWNAVWVAAIYPV